MFVVYQIGDVPLFHTLVGSNGQPVSVDTSRKWRYPSTEFSGVGGSTSYIPLTHALAETPDIKVSGVLHALPPYSIGRSLNALKSLGGRRNIPLIGFPLENPLLENNRISDLLWLYTDVTIVDMGEKSEYNNESDVWSFDTQGIDITLKAGLRWRSLSPWFWEYRDPYEYIIAPGLTNAQVGMDNYFRHPQRFEDIRENHYFYRWQSTLSNYDTLFWGLKYDSGLLGGYGSDFRDFGEFQFYSDPQLWSADPSSIYAFTGLLPGGEISITVQRPTGLFSNDFVEEVSTLDLVQLDADMAIAGYTGLAADDIVYTGALSPFPGFVQRDGVKLEGLRPKWDYPSTYVGETGRGYNTFIVSSVGTTGQVAFLHEYGAL